MRRDKGYVIAGKQANEGSERSEYLKGGATCSCEDDGRRGRFSATAEGYGDEQGKNRKRTHREYSEDEAGRQVLIGFEKG